LRRVLVSEVGIDFFYTKIFQIRHIRILKIDLT